MTTALLCLIFLLSCLSGFSARRGTICLVRATSEIIARKPAKTLVFIVEAVTVALAITIPAFLLFPDQLQLATSYQISPLLFVGALIYGIGAVINGGCALGTLNSVVGGNLSFVGTILGMVLGSYLHLLYPDEIKIDIMPLATNIWENAMFVIPGLLLSWFFVAFSVHKFLISNVKRKLQYFINAPVARDFIAVSLLGISSALLYLIFGHSWDYTRWIVMSEEIVFNNLDEKATYTSLSVAIVGAIMGIAIATRLSQSFRLSGIDLKPFVVRVIAGIFLGLGAGLIPGGNDTLIIYGLPGIALHAPIAIMIIMLTIAAVLMLNMNNLFPLIWRPSDFIKQESQPELQEKT